MIHGARGGRVQEETRVNCPKTKKHIRHMTTSNRSERANQIFYSPYSKAAILLCVGDSDRASIPPVDDEQSYALGQYTVE